MVTELDKLVDVFWFLFFNETLSLCNFFLKNFVYAMYAVNESEFREYLKSR